MINMPGDIKATVERFVEFAQSEYPALEMKIDDEAPEGKISLFVGHFNSHIYIDEETGETETELKPDTGIVLKLQEALGQKHAPTPPAIRNSEPKREIVPRDATVRDLQISDLTAEFVRTYLQPRATEAEAVKFIMECQARGLNPIIGEAHLVKYSESDPAKTVVGKDAFTKRASEDPAFEYYRAGIIVQKGDQIEEREGTFYAKGEDLIGGWAEVYLKDREKPFKYSIRREGFDKKKAVWNQIPEVMCRKCALVGALREALPEKLGGLYDAAEMKDVVDVEYMVEA